MAQVPVLELSSGEQLTQSLAILEFLEEEYPAPSILPLEAVQRAHARRFAEMVNSGVQPLQNLSVLQHLKLGWDIDGKTWGRQVIQRGLDALELSAAACETGRFLVGDNPTVADICLVPQLYNARRFGCDFSRWRRLLQVEAACQSLPAFEQTNPERCENAASSAA